MKKCASCGGMLEDNYNVCPFCGANVGNEPAAQNGGYDPQVNAPQNAAPQSYAAVPAPAVQKPTNSMGIAGMVIGILSYCFCWVPVLGLILGLIGVILSGVGMSRKERCRLNGFAIAGLILSIIAMVLGLIMTIILLAALGAAGGY